MGDILNWLRQSLPPVFLLVLGGTLGWALRTALHGRAVELAKAEATTWKNDLDRCRDARTRVETERSEAIARAEAAERARDSAEAKAHGLVRQHEGELADLRAQLQNQVVDNRMITGHGGGVVTSYRFNSNVMLFINNYGVETVQLLGDMHRIGVAAGPREQFDIKAPGRTTPA